MTSTVYAGGLSRHQVVAWRNAVFVIFTVCGMVMSSWVARLPTVRDTLHADPQQVGLLAFGVAVGSILGLLGSGHIVSRFGATITIRWCQVIAAVGIVVAGIGVTIAPNFAVTLAGLVVFGAAFGICDVCMNLSGAANERVLGRSIMPLFHAFFSLGTVLGALLGALAEAVHLPIAVHVSVIAVVVAAAALIASRSLQSEHLVDDARAEDLPRPGWRERLAIWRDVRTLLIGLIALGIAFAEGSANDWLALATVDGHHVSNEAGAVVFGVFVAAMTVGRVAGVFLLDRFGRVPVLRICGVLAIAGLGVVIFGPNVWVACIGVVLWGLGASLGFPVAMSAAADDPRTAAARVSAVATIGYFAFLVGPVLIGFLSQHVGYLHALIAVLVVVAAATLASGAARKPEITAARVDG